MMFFSIIQMPIRNTPVLPEMIRLEILNSFYEVYVSMWLVLFYDVFSTIQMPIRNTPGLSEMTRLEFLSSFYEVYVSIPILGTGCG